LTADTRFRTFLIVEGDGANGKSVLDTLANLLGPSNVSRVPLEIFGERLQLMRTFGKLENIAPEVDNVSSPRAPSSDSSGATRSAWTGRPRWAGVPATARLVVATNNRPTIADRSAVGENDG